MSTINEIMLSKVNASEIPFAGAATEPVMATPAAFVVGFKAGMQVSAWVVAAFVGGAAIANAMD